MLPQSKTSDQLTIKVDNPTQTTLKELKSLVEKNHIDKPPCESQKIIYKGKQLTNDDQLLSELLAQGLSAVTEAKFHLLIDQRVLAMKKAAMRRKEQAEMKKQPTISGEQ